MDFLLSNRLLDTVKRLGESRLYRPAAPLGFGTFERADSLNSFDLGYLPKEEVCASLRRV